MKTGLIWHELYMWHDTQNYAGVIQPGTHLQPGTHFENPESKRRFKNVLDVTGLSKALHFLDPEPATREQILAIHTRDYLERLEPMNETGGDAGGLSPFGPGSVDIAKLSAGAVITLVDGIMSGKVDNGYALNRPPGHHAMPNEGSGFCMFCNGAIAAQHLLDHHGLGRVAIMDWDVHHGNGAEAAFYDRSDVLTMSIHQDRCFPPDTGMAGDVGKGEGRGYNINVPLPPGTGSGGYDAVFEKVILPALENYQPDFIIVPSGFDAGGQDPLGRMMLSSNDYGRYAKMLMSAADRLCGGRIAFCHEGGYNAYTVPFMGLRVIEALSGLKSGMEDPFAPLIEGMGYQELQGHQAAVIEAASIAVHEIKGPKTLMSMLGS